MMKDKPKASLNEMLAVGVLTCLFIFPIILLYVFDFTVISLLTQYGAPFLWLLGWILFGFGIFFSTVYLKAYWRDIRWRAFIPALFLCLSLSVVRLLPLSDWSLHLDVALKHAERQRVVMEIQRQFIHEQNIRQLVKLPIRQRFLSSGGGEVVVKKVDNQLSVMFYIWRGVLDASSGLIIYTSDNSLPSSYIGYAVFEEPLQEHWYFVIWP